MMTAAQEIVDQIMAHSDALRIVEDANNRLKAEQEERIAFYDAINEDDKAEFINGEIVFHSPVMKLHNDATKLLVRVLDIYVTEYDLGYVGVEKILTRFTRNDYEPDICFFDNDKAQHFEGKQLLFSVPDFVVEVLSKSSQQNIERDTVTKFEDYQQHGVGEYWIVDPHEQTVAQYVLKNGQYRLVLPTDDTIQSVVVKGFHIPIAAVFDPSVNQQMIKKLMVEGRFI